MNTQRKNLVLIKIVTEAIKIAARKYAYPVARGITEIERPLFRYAYRGKRMGRFGKPIYKGYKAGTVIGLAGDAILDALLSESDVPETSEIRKTRSYMVTSRSKRLNKADYRACLRNRRRTKYRKSG